MTSVDITVLSTSKICRLLGTEKRRLRQLIHDHMLIRTRDASGTRGIPREAIVEGGGGWGPLPFLQGTLALLADDGFTAEEAATWPCTIQDELGRRPIDALTSGHHHRADRIASALAF